MISLLGIIKNVRSKEKRNSKNINMKPSDPYRSSITTAKGQKQIISSLVSHPFYSYAAMAGSVAGRRRSMDAGRELYARRFTVSAGTPEILPLVALSTISVMTSLAELYDFMLMYNAAMPAVWGVAMDVYISCK